MGFSIHRQNRLIISLGLHSAAIIAFQLALMQLISIVQWHHFAYMIISVAMLGFGASGTLLALYREKLLEKSRWLVPLLMTISGFFMMVAFEITRLEFFRFDVYLLFVELSQFPVLAANYVIFFIPFFTGALSIGILFIENARQIGTYYFSNLLGSGVGGLLVLLLFGIILPQQVPPFIGLLSVMAGLFSISASFRKIQVVGGIVAIAVSGLLISKPGTIPVSEYKDLSTSLNLPEAEIVHSRPDIHGLIEVVASPALRYAPSVSLQYQGEVPVKKNIYVNADFYGVIPQFDPEKEDHILDHTTQALPYVTGKRQRALMLNAGTGSALSQALLRGVAEIDAIIENAGVIEMMKTDFAEESGELFLHENLQIHQMQARNFLAAKAPEGYDLITLPLQESFGGTAGLHALQENYSMTLEAFDLMWQRLSPEGVIAISSWMDFPARTTLKLLATLAETARKNGIENPSEYIAAIRSWGTVTFILKKNPLNDKEIEKIREFSKGKNFDLLLLPDLQPGEREQFNMMEDQSFFKQVDRIMEGDKYIFDEYVFYIKPATDDKPYFSQFLKLSAFRHLSGIFGQQNVPFLELGYLIVIVTLVQSFILAGIFIILPLFRLRKSSKGKWGSLLYFGALGLGYMFAEIILIQRFVLYFGHPVYALSAVISTMLIFSGAGSLTSGRLPAKPKFPGGIGLTVAVLLLAYGFTLTGMLQTTIAIPLALKIIISLILIGVPAFFMGMLFPLGIRFLADHDESQVPWAWGINGSISVISTSLAMLIAVESGFRIVIMVAVVSYLLAAIAFGFHRIFFKDKPVS